MALVPLLALAGACGSSGPKAPPTTAAPVTTSTSTSTTSTSTTTTTVPVVQASGPETVLSPIGLNVRARPSKSAPVLGTADEGTVLQLLGHTSQDGGWYKVLGATVTGWISANPALSAPGRFSEYGPGAFTVLFPAGWTSAGAPRTGVTFRPPTGTEAVVIVAAPKLAQLPSVKQGNGVSEISAKQVVACGVTSRLFTYTTATAGHYLADLVLPAAANHYFGLKATMTSLSQLVTVLRFVNSLSFPLPVCVGRPPSPTTSAHLKTGHPATPSTT